MNVKVRTGNGERFSYQHPLPRAKLRSCEQLARDRPESRHALPPPERSRTSDSVTRAEIIPEVRVVVNYMEPNRDLLSLRPFSSDGRCGNHPKIVTKMDFLEGLLSTLPFEKEHDR